MERSDRKTSFLALRKAECQARNRQPVLTTIVDRGRYLCMAGFVLTTGIILLQRISGMWFNLKHQDDYQTAELTFKYPSQPRRYYFGATSLLRRCCSVATCHKIDRCRYQNPISTDRNIRWTEVQLHRYMATQRAVMYADSTMQTQCAVIDEAQVIDVLESHSIEAKFDRFNTGVMTTPKCLCCRLTVGSFSVEGWVYLRFKPKEMEDDKGGKKLSGREFNTVFVKEHNEMHRYYKVNRATTIGQHFEVAKCQRSRTREELTALGRRTEHLQFSTIPCCCCDFVLQAGDVVQTVGEPKKDPGSCACGRCTSAGERCDGQTRLEVVGPKGTSIGWISKEKEHVLSDDVRMVLHKSKLNIAQVWAVAHAEAEDFRRAEALFKSINDFRRITATERAQLFLSTLPLRLFYGWHFLPTSRWCI